MEIMGKHIQFIHQISSILFHNHFLQALFEKEIQFNNNVDNRIHNEQDETSNYENYQDIYNSDRQCQEQSFD